MAYVPPIMYSRHFLESLFDEGRPVSQIDIAYPKDSVYAFGGYSKATSNSDPMSSVDRLDLATLTWSPARNMRVPRGAHSATLVPKSLFDVN